MGNTPNIRFKGFTDDWEQRKLGDVLSDLYNGQTPSRLKEEYWKGDISWLSSGELNRGHVNHTIEKITKAGQESAHLRLIPSGTFVMAITGLEAPGTRGNCAILDFDTTLNQSCMALFPKKDMLTSEFLFQWYCKVGEDYGVRFTQGTKQQSYNSEIIKDLDICLPKVDEQKKISDSLENIDHLITLHQRKCDETKELKKFMLQKMFPKNGEKKPEIRFEGFTDDWEQRKLIEYLEVSKEKNKDESFGKEDVLSVSGDYGIVNQIEFQGRSFAGVSVAPYGVVETGDIVYTKSPLKSNPYGIIKTNKGKPGIVSTLYAVYKPLDNVYSEFVQIYFEYDARMNNYMHPLVNKGAKNDMKVSDENALKGLVSFPQKAEQIAISGYFDNLDNLITLHQRKCDEIKEIKKFMLQNMFPQKG